MWVVLKAAARGLMMVDNWVEKMVVRMVVGWVGMRVDESVEHWIGLSVVERVESTVVPRAEQWVVL